MQSENTERIKPTINWNPNNKRPRGKPKKSWKDKVKDNMERLGITNWNEYTQDIRKSLRVFVAAAKAPKKSRKA